VRLDFSSFFNKDGTNFFRKVNCMEKPLLFAANWKLNKTPRETREFLNKFIAQCPQAVQSKVAFYLPATNLESASDVLSSTSVQWGSQNCYSKISGAFTGEISAGVVKELGANTILLGHSERRQVFGEDNNFIAEKGHLVQSLSLMPMLCIGETLEQRDKNLTLAICEAQLSAFLERINPEQPWAIAYEPVWAIGTGRIATLTQVEEVHNFIHDFLERRLGESLAKRVLILYGGSVKPENSKELLTLKNVNGFLVGGASLEVESFLKICAAGF
jgi:triosephosphate isomerase